MLKKKCPKCANKLSRKYQFCPYCGFNFSRDDNYDSEDYGFLGRDDGGNIGETFGNIPMNKLIKTAMKMTEKMMKDIQQQNNPPKQHYNNANMDIQFFVNGKRVFSNNENPRIKERASKVKKSISKEKAEQFAKLPKKEPVYKMRRMGEKIIYELEVPGVENIEDILINQLENSIEIKALSKNKVYSKIINLNLPIIRYVLDNGNLILELQAK
jgi:HSP20 family molecular chaperone IbpA